VEDILGEEDMVHHIHRHDFYFVLALDKGVGTHQIDFVSYKVMDKSIFFLRPGQVHELELKVGSSGYLVEFNREFYRANDKLSSQRLRKASNKTYCQIEVQRFDKIEAILHSIYLEYTSREDGYQDYIRSSLDLFFIEFVRQSPSPNSNAPVAASYAQERFEEFLELVDQHITSHKQVSYYADLMNLSLYQLNEITKSSVGKTASDLLNEHILLEAKRYLLATPNQVKEVADLLGYEDTSYFIRFFKKHTGKSPEAFRNTFK
jgi:AraC family transcriptional regulator, transcriptional activator of pobA